MIMPATIVVGVDGSNDSERTVECAARLADAMDSHLLTVFVFREAGAFTGTAGAGAILKETMNDLAIDAEVISITHLNAGRVPWDFQTAVGDPASELLRVAHEHGASMLVIGRRGQPRFADLFGRSMSDRLVREADIPVLVVPHEHPVRRWLTGSRNS